MASTQDKNAKSCFRVLSLDGGGMRGLYTASVLATVAKNISKNGHPDIGKGFDLITGTSTGGILACALAYGLSPESVINLYSNLGQKIFPSPTPKLQPRKKDEWFVKWMARNKDFFDWASKAAGKSSADAGELETALKQLFHEETLSSLYGRRNIALCIPSIKMFRETARVFKTGHHSKKCMDDDVRLVDVCMATSAAPVYFPLAKVPSTNVEVSGYYTDGGLWANNPMLVGLIEALSLTEPTTIIQIISIGTSPAPSGSNITETNRDPGLLGWQFGTRALSVSMNAQSDGVNNMVSFLAGEFSRLNRQVKVVRFPQFRPSADHTELLKLDLASEEAVALLKTSGEEDGIEVLKMWQKNTDEGQVVESIFKDLPSIDPKLIEKTPNPEQKGQEED